MTAKTLRYYVFHDVFLFIYYDLFVCWSTNVLTKLFIGWLLLFWWIFVLILSFVEIFAKNNGFIVKSMFTTYYSVTPFGIGITVLLVWEIAFIVLDAWLNITKSIGGESVIPLIDSFIDLLNGIGKEIMHVTDFIRCRLPSKDLFGYLFADSFRGLYDR